MRLNHYLQRHLIERLNASRILVWYDGERAFGDFVRQFQAPNCRVVLAETSLLAARHEAEAVYRELNEPGLPNAGATLLIYVPRPRLAPEARTQDPFELFAAAGAVFGESENEQLQSLAHAAMPDLVERIDVLFASGRPALDVLDQLRLESTYPLVEQALGTQSAVEACALLLGSEPAQAKVEAVPGARQEFLRLLKGEIGFVPPSKARAWPAIVGRLGEYVLLSELAFDLPDPWPDALAIVGRAEPPHRERVFAICERLRDSDEWREAYIALANRVEQEFRLREHFQGHARLGVRDTFAFEERQYLAALTAAVQANDLLQARSILDGRRRSVWRHQPERAQVWQAAERCLDLLAAAIRVEQVKTTSLKLAGLVEAYTRADGWSDLDRHQRLMEQSWTDCVECDEIQSVVELARRRYRDASLRMQTRLLKRAEEEGWPPEGILRQTQVFDRYVAPLLERRTKVAYVLADSLRYEMGRALAEELKPLGDLGLRPAAAALPTVTVNGMAALLPGADGALSVRTVGDQLIPHLGDRPLKTSDDRMALLAERYGDRFAHVTLSDWLDARDKKRAELAAHDLLVLRVPDIDELGEGVNSRQARKHMSGLLGDLKRAAAQLVRLGFGTIVFAADHGHVLLPEVPAGDAVQAPEGQWLLSKRRVKVGSGVKERAGTLVFKPGHLGIQTDAAEYVIPSGFGVYAADAVYFHEGLSLPECIVPVIELQAKGKPEGAGRQQQIEIRYPRNRFTSQVIGLKLHYLSMLNEPLRIRLEAYDTADAKRGPVGEAADCAVRDEDTHEVTLAPNTETDVPLLIEPGFTGEAIEIRAVDPGSGVIWARLKLKNGVLD